MYYTIYKITNLINNKIYIGKHQTKNLNDGYMGSGKDIGQAKIEFGLKNFSKEILFILDTEEEMNAKEAELVSKDFLLEDNVYNMALGGDGGWSHLNDGSEAHIERTKRGGIARDLKCKELKIGIYSETYINPFKTVEIQQMGNTKEAREKASKKLKKTFKKNNHQQKDKNSQFDTMWIYSLELKQNKKINKNDFIPNGWNKGRKIKF